MELKFIFKKKERAFEIKEAFSDEELNLILELNKSCGNKIVYTGRIVAMNSKYLVYKEVNVANKSNLTPENLGSRIKKLEILV